MTRCVWSVGHSNHSSERLLELLAGQQIAFVVDVRSYPYSRVAPQHNREALAAWLAAEQIRYLYLGAELGGRPEDPEHYDREGHALYAPMSEQAEFRTALGRVLDGARDHRIALLCSEGDPTHCHRRLLVGKVLAEHGVELRHILRDGSVLGEREVQLPNESQQCSLLEEHAPWRSTQSVSQRARLSTSSAA
ncbi:MAG: DUF488 domain-containing protein [Solirubrobacteraceae bacterium]